MKLLGHFGIERNQRICTLCNGNCLGDEFHTVSVTLNLHVKKVIYKDFRTHPSSYKMEKLMNTQDKSVLLKLALFCKIVMNSFIHYKSCHGFSITCKS